MNPKAFGEKYPKYSNDSEEGRSQNRRVEFLITANEKMKSDAKKKQKKQTSKIPELLLN